MSGRKPGGIAGGEEHLFVTILFCNFHDVFLEYLLFGHAALQYLGLYKTEPVGFTSQYRHSLFDFIFRSHIVSFFCFFSSRRIQASSCFLVSCNSHSFMVVTSLRALLYFLAHILSFATFIRYSSSLSLVKP